MMVAGTAAAVGMALINERKLAPALVSASPALRTAAPATSMPAPTARRDARPIVGRHLGLALVLAFGGIVLATIIPAITAFVVDLRTSSPGEAAGPAMELRAAAGVTGNWERAYSASAPPADQLGAAVVAAAEEQRAWDALQYMVSVSEMEQAEKAGRSVRASYPPRSMNGASGYAVGTVLRARITIYGCTGPGGGFCNNMASGIPVFEGAAACSPDLPFGTKLRIHGDPTGRIYECLDRGALSSTWVDVYFENTSDGMAWASQLGGTVANIEIVN